MLFIHVRDGDKLYGADNRGVSTSDVGSMLPLIRQTVREIIDDEGGPAINEARLIEVVDQAGALLLTMPFVSAYARH